MSLLSTLHGMIRRPTGGRKGCRQGSGRTRRLWQLALEILEDRLCLSGDLLVSSFYTNSVLAYDGTQGTFLQSFASGSGLAKPVGLALGANDDLYVSGRDSNDVLRFDGNSGLSLGTFVAPGSGGLDGPHALTFGPDGNLYVNSGFNASVLRYDGTTGASLGTFVTPHSGGLGFPHGLTIGPDHNFYVGDRNTNSVLRYNGATGAFVDAFVPAGSGGLNITTGLTFGPDGNLYVDSFNTNSVLRYDGKTGAFLGTFASGGGLSGPQGLVFGPDGNLYVSSFNTASVLRYNGTTGAFIDVFASGGGLSGPTYLLFRHTHSTTTINSSANPSVFGQPVTYTATVSGVAGSAGAPSGTVTFTVDGTALAPVTLNNGQATFTASALSVGGHIITAAYNGDLGFSTSTTAALNQSVNRANTTTTVGSSADPSVFGQLVTFTATVSAVAPGAGTPTGTVTFSVDGTAQAPATLSNGQATFAISTLSVGSHDIAAAYSGDGNFNSSFVDPIQRVNKAATTTTVSSSAEPSVFGQAVIFTATVAVMAPGTGTPTGTVTFSVDGTPQAPVTLSNGQVTFTTSMLSVGGHSITAAYNGDLGFSTSTAPLNQSVNRANTTTAVSSSADPSVFRRAVTFTATVAAVGPGVGTPTGTVTFTVDGTAQTPVNLNNGQATFTTSTLRVGSHVITASYNGDANFTTSTSANFTQTVWHRHAKNRHRDRNADRDRDDGDVKTRRRDRKEDRDRDDVLTRHTQGKTRGAERTKVRVVRLAGRLDPFLARMYTSLSTSRRAERTSDHASFLPEA